MTIGYLGLSSVEADAYSVIRKRWHCRAIQRAACSEEARMVLADDCRRTDFKTSLIGHRVRQLLYSDNLDLTVKRRALTHLFVRVVSIWGNFSKRLDYRSLTLGK